MKRTDSNLHIAVFLRRAIHISLELGGKVAYAVKSRMGCHVRDRIQVGAQQIAGNLDSPALDIFYGRFRIISFEFASEIRLAGFMKSCQMGDAKLGRGEIFIHILLPSESVHLQKRKLIHPAVSTGVISTTSM